ncbi:MAG: MFS transporter [Buchnera aphidicola (Floraphis choui)]
MNKLSTNIKEWRIILGICLVFALRVLGMFIVLPVFSTYGISLRDSTIFLSSIAIGSYGFFQALFQIPYGWLSDKIGRKIVIILGLLFFLIGSYVCLNSNSIWGMILGRSIQGSGAISSVCMVLLSETISKQNKTKAMGLLGISFGASFVISMVISPIIVRIFGFHSVFFVSFLLSILCILVVWFVIPFSKFNKKIYIKNEYKIFLSLFKRSNLFQLDLNIFFLHVLLILHFIVIPIQLHIYISFIHSAWIIYLITIIVSFIVVLPINVYIKDKKHIKIAILCSIVLLMISNFIFLFFKNNYIFLILGLQIFFIVFSFFEMIFPILVSKNSPKDYKGTAMAIYSISQFLGSSIGSILGGLILNFYGSSLLFLFELIIIFIWFFINIRYLKI